MAKKRKKSPKIWVMRDDGNDVVVGSTRQAVRDGGDLGMAPPCYAGFLEATHIRLNVDKPVAIRVVKYKS